MDSSPQPNQPTFPVLQTILNKTFEEIKPFGKWLKKNAEGYLIGEHPPGTKKGIHCHILIEGLKVTREALRKEVQKYAPGKGQNCTMAETQEVPKRPYDRDLLAVYIIKGNREYVKDTSYTQEYIDIQAPKWVTRPAYVPPEGQGHVPSPKKKPNTKWQDCQEIIDGYLKDEDWYRTKQVPYVSPTLEARTRIPGYIIAWANSKQKAMNSYLVADYYDIILCNALPELYANQCAAIINNRHRFSH